MGEGASGARAKRRWLGLATWEGEAALRERERERQAQGERERDREGAIARLLLGLIDYIPLVLIVPIELGL